ncbi:N-acetylmuramoyl-L-alanine amidase AmiC [Zhongshania aliphaticivorans]|uniref:N-acetylmuramoyl-L-alanine amidase AmiC n=1 Tax=Zhongshania aliphaticivorans TaxID=1470434 RepID=A0A5S9N1Y5_9GAMM|nr:N-acetylmuramoyl-L-alanine amidase [Zhongshania aliphaticivorans]CAA0081887.1 N-acetylmuramoyl-L-alanine amidase AmiC [Zhongshania aliphaticivorans]CAA0084694.1 N-acetylmuramoyl-L-alanine amidase AmiC [Zhongshania aliphaticivorans]
MKRISSALLCSLVFWSAALQAAEIRDVRFWRAPDHSRVVFDLSGSVEHELITLDKPDRLVIDIQNTKLSSDTSKLEFANSPISRLRHAEKPNGTLRIVFDLNNAVQVRSFLLAASGDLQDRLVVDFLDSGQGAGASASAKPSAPKVVKSVENSSHRNVVIAIDAGHGGEDPGAIGPGRIKEKDVVYKIAQRLQERFERKKGYQVVMIRDGDYYVGLAKRRDLARKAQADFFVSIHADAFTNPSANGSSVYALSKRGATSASARILAQRENKADLVGGVSLSDKDQVLAGVLTDLSMTATLDASLSVGGQLLGEMGKISRLHSKRVEQAGFAVLKSPDIPSLLVETGFISNPHEASKLKSSNYQSQMAQAIYEGIDRYFRESPPPDTYFAAVKRGDISPAGGRAPVGAREYVIARGDTLSGIAHRYNVPLSDLQRHNQLSGSNIRVGQKIKIPAS